MRTLYLIENTLACLEAVNVHVGDVCSSQALDLRQTVPGCMRVCSVLMWVHTDGMNLTSGRPGAKNVFAHAKQTLVLIRGRRREGEHLACLAANFLAVSPCRCCVFVNVSHAGDVLCAGKRRERKGDTKERMGTRVRDMYQRT